MSQFTTDSDRSGATITVDVPFRMLAWWRTWLYLGMGTAVLVAIGYSAWFQLAGPDRTIPWVLFALLPWALLWCPFLMGTIYDVRRGYSIVKLYCRGLTIVALGDGKTVSSVQYAAVLSAVPAGFRALGRRYLYSWFSEEDAGAIKRYILHHKALAERQGPRSQTLD